MPTSYSLQSEYQPTGDQPQAIKNLVDGVQRGAMAQTLLGVTGSGKTFTVANVIAQIDRPTLILSHNKTLAAQLYSEMKTFFPHNAVEYFVSYYDYYQPEAYIPSTDTYIEKDLDVNQEIDRLRLSAVAALLSGRKDVIVVSSVSCLYGLGSPQDFTKSCITLEKGKDIPMDSFYHLLLAAQYLRNDIELSRGHFRVKGDTVDVALAYVDYNVRIEFFGETIDRIYTFRQEAGGQMELLDDFEAFNIYPANIFATNKERFPTVFQMIRADLAKQMTYFETNGQPMEAERLNQRVNHDIEMMDEIGYCSGIENYSRYFDGREPGTPPYCLLDYFPDEMLLVVDESHVTVPQIHAMYGGDKARKDNLINYGFRLPVARDNRPLTFEEWEHKMGLAEHNPLRSTIFLSATPADYELQKSEGVVVEQLIRPTGLLDPEIFVRPTKNQVDDLMEEIQCCVEKGERVLVTTLTKRMAEELDDYLRQYDVRSAYIHSDVDTIERVKIMEDLRKGIYDVLVGVNLLREGLDLPEVSLVAIFDADKEGFLRNTRSLTQTAGRAARHVNGRVIMYADSITPSMQQTIDETERRRTIQITYNTEHHITPTPIKKAINSTAIASLYKSAEVIEENLNTKIRTSWSNADWQKMDVPALEKAIVSKKRAMLQAAKDMDFNAAALLRDEMFQMQDRLQAIRRYKEIQNCFNE